MAGHRRPQLPSSLSFAPAGTAEIVQETAYRLDGLYRRPVAFGEPPRWLALMDRLARWTHIAPFNLMLADVQRPGVAFVAFEEQWKWVERELIDDALPVLLLWPFCPVRCAYTPDQTKGPDVSFQRLLEIFGGRLHMPQDPAARLARRTLTEDRIHIDFPGAPALIKAVRRPANTQKIWKYLTCAWHPSDAKLFEILLPDLITCYLGHRGGNGNKWSNRSSIPPDVRKLECESACWLVKSRFGLESRSASYLLGGVDVPPAELSLASIIKAAGRIEQYLRLPEDTPLLQGRV
jgi:hypothetical protein